MGFNVSFKCARINKQGYATVLMVININGDRVSVPLMRKERPEDFKKQMNGYEMTDLKIYLSNTYKKLQDVIAKMEELNLPITASTVKDKYVNGLTTIYTFKTLYREFLSLQSQKERSGQITFGVVRKYMLVAEDFLKFAGDVNTADVTKATISQYFSLLKSRYQVGTANAYFRKLKSMWMYGMDATKIKHNPFNGIKVERKDFKVEYLTEEELERIENLNLTIDRLIKVRDLFLFQCYTGLSFCDMMSLQLSDIKTSEKGAYITRARQKTKINYTAYLSSKALAILDKYNGLPKVSNVKCNAYLKEIGDLAGINKDLHTHLARKTCATIMLNRGVSLDIVAKVLGHSTTAITKVYANMLDTTVIDKMREVFD